MTIITAHTDVPYHAMQLVLSVFYMHNFISLIILLTDTYFHKREFSVIPKCIS